MGVNTATLHITVSHTLHTFTHHNDELNRSVDLMRDRVRGVGFGEDLAAWKLYNNGDTLTHRQWGEITGDEPVYELYHRKEFMPSYQFTMI
jgi:hypothetical protein